jgi:hypothetical protein
VKGRRLRQSSLEQQPDVRRRWHRVRPPLPAALACSSRDPREPSPEFVWNSWLRQPLVELGLYDHCPALLQVCVCVGGGVPYGVAGPGAALLSG